MTRITTYLLVATFALVACGATGFRAQQQTDRYTVALQIDQPATGAQRVTIEVTDATGAPARVDTVVLAPVMRDMGHVTPELTLGEVAPGRYEGMIELFSMTGTWEIDVRISAGVVEETTTFRVVVQ